MVVFEEFDDRYQYFIHGTNNDDVETFLIKGYCRDMVVRLQQL